MASITTRAGKGTPLTNAEVDANFTNLNTELGQKLTGNQNITFTGDATGSGTTAVSLTLANSGAVAGTYGSSTNIPQIAVDAKGRITSVSNVAVSIPSGSLTFTGDVTGTGTTGSSTALTLANSGVTAGTYTKVTVDAKGRVTVGAALASADLPTYTGTLTSTQVTTALGFTPFSAAGGQISGNTGVGGAASANARLRVLGSGSSSEVVRFEGGTLSALLLINQTDDPGVNTNRSGVSFRKNNTEGGAISVDYNGTRGIVYYDAAGATGQHAFYVNGVDRMRLSPSGGLSFSGAGYGTAGQFLKSGGANGSAAWAALTSGEVTTALGFTPISGNQTITVSGDASGSGTTAISLTLANSGVTAGTYTKVTVDAKGRVTTGTTLASADLPTYTGTLTSSQVTTALGYTPLDRAVASFDWNTKTNGQAVFISSSTNSHNGVTNISGLYMPHSTGGFGVQVGGRLDNLYFRTEESGTWAAWRTLIHSGNFTSYSPSLTGSGASGTWGISITGNAANVTGTVALANGGTGSTTAAGARTNLGATTAGANLFTLTNPSAVTFLRVNADNTVSALDAATFRTAIGAGTSSTTGTVTSVSGTGSVSGLTLSGTVTSSGSLTLGGTLSASIDNITDEHRLFNNMGDAHGARTSFDATTPSYNFGWRYVQGNTNGPGVNSASQYYSLYVGLGNDYPATGAGSYGMQIAIPRNVTTPYLTIRYNEANSLAAWQKISAGYADSAATLTTARNINGTSFNGSANITTASWGTARTLTIGSTGKSVDGSANVSWSLAEIGALASGAKAADADLLDGYNSTVFSGPVSPVKQFFWNNLEASGTQARTYEIARLAIDFNDWNSGSGPFEVELYEGYYSRGLKKKYVIHWGYTNAYGIQLVEYSGSGDNNFQCRIGTPVQVSGDHYYLSVFVDVRYYAGVDVRVTTNRDITASNPPAIGTTFINASPTATNISDFTADSTVNFASTTAVQIGGSQLLHAGNYTSYSPSLTGSGASGTWGINVTGSAATLTTARTLTVGSTGKTFNGSANVSWSLAEIGALPLAGGTLTGELILNGAGYRIGSNAFEKHLSASFPNGTANLAADIRFGNLSFWGYIEVEVTGTYSNQNTAGKLTKLFAVGTNPGNLIYNNVSRVADAMGSIVDNIAIGDFAWDATNSTYRIPISHIVSTGNDYTIRVRMFTHGGGAGSVAAGITMSSNYTLTALAAHTAVTFNTNLLVNGTSQVLHAGNYTNYISSSGFTSGKAMFFSSF